MQLEVGRVGNFAGYRIRVPGRYYPAGSGYVTCEARSLIGSS